jgi:hypothetical protein
MKRVKWLIHTTSPLSPVRLNDTKSPVRLSKTKTSPGRLDNMITSPVRLHSTTTSPVRLHAIIEKNEKIKRLNNAVKYLAL